MKWFLALATSLVVLTQAASAQTIPEYNGVYLRLSSGELVQLDQVASSRIVYHVSPPNPRSPSDSFSIIILSHTMTALHDQAEGIRTRLLDRRPFNAILDAFSAAQLTPIAGMRSNIQSIVIRSRNPELIFVEHLTRADMVEHRLSAFNRVPNLEVAFETPSWRLANDQTFVRNYWGWDASQFGERILDTYTSEYAISGHVQLGFETRGFGSSIGLPLYGLFIMTSDGEYGVRF